MTLTGTLAGGGEVPWSPVQVQGVPPCLVQLPSPAIVVTLQLQCLELAAFIAASLPRPLLHALTQPLLYANLTCPAPHHSLNIQTLQVFQPVLSS